MVRWLQALIRVRLAGLYLWLFLVGTACHFQLASEHVSLALAVEHVGAWQNAAAAPCKPHPVAGMGA